MNEVARPALKKNVRKKIVLSSCQRSDKLSVGGGWIRDTEGGSLQPREVHTAFQRTPVMAPMMADGFAFRV